MARADPPLYLQAPRRAFDAARLGLPIRPSSWTAWDALWAVGGSILLANLTAVLLAVLGLEFEQGWILLALAAPWVAMIGWPLLASKRRGNGAAVDLGLQARWSDALWGLLGGIAAFVSGLVAGIMSIQLFGDFTSAAGDEAQRLAEESSPWVLLVFALMVVIGAPIAEELAFRGLLWSGLAKRGFPVWVPILVSTVAFALIHFEPKRMLVLLSIGLVLGVIRWRTRSLSACIVAHAVNNLPGAIGILALSATPT